MSTAKVCLQCGTDFETDALFCPRDGSALKLRDPGSALIGTVVAERFLIERQLGEGGMGRVYLAEQVRIGRRCALKVIREGLVSDADSVLRFNREASNAARISHPNVVQVYDFGESREGVIFLAMELVEGESLASVLTREGAISPLRAVSIIAQVASALAAAHELKIVHRDLKPDNIMLTRSRDGSDQVKVVDFGVSRVMDSAEQHVTGTGLVIGTPEYMSPEQFTGGGVDGRSDLYALAMIAFRMLAGSPPFEASNAREAFDARFQQQPKRLAEANSSIAWPPGLQEVIDRGMAVHAKDRYQTVEEFSAAVVAITSYWDPEEGRAARPQGEGLSATAAMRGGFRSLPTGASIPVPSAAAPALARPGSGAPSTSTRSATDAQSPPGAPRTSRVAAGGLLVAAAVGIAVVGSLVWRGATGARRQEIPTPPTSTVATAPLVPQTAAGTRPEGGEPTGNTTPNATTTTALATPSATVTESAPPVAPTKSLRNAETKSPTLQPAPASSATPSGADTESPAVLRGLAELKGLTDKSATPEQAVTALRLATAITPSTQGGRVELKYRMLEAHILLDHTTEVCSLLSALRFEARGTRFEGGVSVFLSQAKESCP